MLSPCYTTRLQMCRLYELIREGAVSLLCRNGPPEAIPELQITTLIR
ncbi:MULTISPECIES: hypothetical protein [Cronobacter]|nr:hypothetical protein [Cronobacter dublinensis]